MTTEPIQSVDPDAIEPSMDGVLRSHGGMAGREDAFLPSPAVQNHAANLFHLPGGSLACVWFGGTMEGMGDISVHMSTLEPGADRWSQARKLTDDPAKSEQNPLLFDAPDGRLRLVYTSQTAGDQDGAVVKCRLSDDGGETFGDPFVLFDEAGTFVRQPVVVNDAGDWLIPAFRCVSLPNRRWSGDADTAAVIRSTDQGATWVLRPVPDSIGAVHMNILPLGGGRMVAFYRDRFASRVRRSWSADDGLTWSAPEATELSNNNSSIQATRLSDGAIVLAFNDVDAGKSADRRLSLYDEIEGEGGSESAAPAAVDDGGRRAIWGVPRAPMSLALSTDGGRRFVKLCDLEFGPGTCLSNNSQEMKNREFSYPSVLEGKDGSLHVAYTVYRRAIRHVRLAPGWRDRLVSAATH